MRKILVLLATFLIFAVPVLADINQNAIFDGENAVEVMVVQEAWNHGSGDINQDIGVHVTGNYQTLSQDENLVLISDSDYNLNNSMYGLNIIRIDLSQYGNNSNSGKIVQSINILVDNNVQILDQNIDLVMIPWVEVVSPVVESTNELEEIIAD